MADLSQLSSLSSSSARPSVSSVPKQPSSQQVLTVEEENDSDSEGSSSPQFYVATLPISTKSHRTSKVWDYFADFDLMKHPNMSLFRICLVCREMKVDKAIKIGPNLSPGPLITHLKVHPREHGFYVAAKHADKHANNITASTSQKNIQTFFPKASDIKVTFKRTF